MAETDTRKTIVLTGASRGIGHATVKRFSREGWRVITCSRQAFAEDCPWPAGPEDHIKVDLADQEDVGIAVSEIRHRLEAHGGQLHALVNNAGISPKLKDGNSRMDSIDTPMHVWRDVFQVNFFAPIMLARGLFKELGGSQRLDRQRHLDRRHPRASLRRHRLCDVEGGTRLADARDGA